MIEGSNNDYDWTILDEKKKEYLTGLGTTYFFDIEMIKKVIDSSESDN